jgi:hypothetical protein
MNFLTSRSRLTTVKIARKRRKASLKKNVEKRLTVSEIFGRYNPSSPETLLRKNNNAAKFSFLKRISPFLLLGFFLIGLFPYFLVTGFAPVHSTLLLIFLFMFLEANLLFTDFALWNYFGRKKIFKIWLIEVPLTVLIILFLI